MITLYRHAQDTGWEYREAWYDEEAGEFVVHRGRVGRNGDLSAEQATAEHAERLLDSFRGRCAADGFQAPEPSAYDEVEVVYPLKGTEPGAAEQRNVTQVHTAALTWLAWRGLGALQDPQQTEHDGAPAMVMTVQTLHRGKAVETIKAAVRSTDVQPSKVKVSARPRSASSTG